MTDEEKLAAARRFFSLLGHPDPDLIREIATEDIVWSFPGTGALSGEARGVDAILVRAGVIASYGVRVEIVRPVYGFNGVAMILHNSAMRNGRVLDAHIAAVFNFRDGRIARLDTYLSDVPMVEKFFI